MRFIKEQLTEGQQRTGNVIFAKHDRHCAVNAFDSKCGQFQMKRSNVAVADNPLWMIHECTKVNRIDDACSSVATAGAKDCLYVRLINKLLQCADSVLISSCKIRVTCIIKMWRKTNT